MTCDFSFPSNGSVSWSCEVPQKMDQSTLDASYRNKSILSGYCATVPSNSIRTSITNHSANNSFLGDGSTTSLRYPLGHQHPLVANASYSADGDSMHYAGITLPSLPRASENHTDDLFSTVMPSNESMTYSRIPVGAFTCVPSFNTNTDRTIYGAALSEQCDIYSMPGSVGCSSAEFINAASSFGLTGNLNVHQLGAQSNLRMKSVDDPSLSAEKDQFLPYFLQHQQKELFSQQQHILVANRMSAFNQSQSILMGSYGVNGYLVQNQIYNQSDHMHLQQNGQYFQQPHLSMGKRKPEWAPHQMVLEGHSQVNSCVIPNQSQVPIKSRPMHNVTKQFNPSVEGCKRKQNIASEGSATVGRVGMPRGEVQYVRCHMFFLAYHHALCCTVRERKCEYPCCLQMKLLIHHISHCSDDYCKQKGCSYSKKLLTHYRRCRVNTCGTCGPNKMRLRNNLQGKFSSNITEPIASFPTGINTLEQVQPPSNCTERGNLNETSKAPLPAKNLLQSFPVEASTFGPHKTRVENNSQEIFSSKITEPMSSFPTTINTIEQEQPPSKRSKSDDPILFPVNQTETSKVSVTTKDPVPSFPERNTLECQELGISVNSTVESMKLENHAECFLVKTGDSVIDIRMKPHLESSNSLELSHAQVENQGVQVLMKTSKVRLEGNYMDTATFDIHLMETKLPKLKKGESSNSLELSHAQVENQGVQVPMKTSKVRLEGNYMDTATFDIHLMETKLPKLKKGVSLIDSFSPEQIKAHMESLRQPVDQNKVKEKESHESGHVMDMKNCSLCGMKDLHFDPPPRYCAACDIKINPKKVYYFMRSNANESDSQFFFCSVCINVPGETIKIHGTSILKANLERRKNYAETFDLRELWVQCHKCKASQHQICTLFNSIKNKTVKAYHTCPNCILQEIESGEHKPLLQRKIPGAKDLPKTILSNHIERRVFRRLEEERQARANSLGNKFSEVPTAEGLVIRVVSSVVKQLEVKPVFRDIFQEETYPSQFPYKSKAILLFQNIDGADVCLFAMYVQEYGSGCADPNRRRVCISYIDSVKYFRPEVKAVTGEVLRSFVYHEILEGYFEHCKKRGFTSFYIWACPPFKGGDDYILYCHPKMQKLPKDGKLREWYQKLIRKAEKEKIVAEHTNLYDHFFVKTSECKAKVTAARLPYFDGDYWPGVAELLLRSEDGNKPQREGTKADDRALRASRRDGLIENPKDVLLMHQLGNNIFPMKENFIMVQLWHNCKHCCQPILSGKQFVCNGCKNFRLCEKCFLIQQSLHIEDRHPIHTSQKHSFCEVPVDDHPKDTIDDEETMQSDRVPVDDHPKDTIDDDKETIQSEIFDTRLMFLGHCQNNYYQFDTLRRAKHSTMMILYNLHNPIPLPSPREDDFIRRCTVTDHNSQQNNQITQVRSLEELSAAPLLHASECNVTSCTYPYCKKLRGLFHHSMKCQIRINGGCKHCRRVWCILRTHSQSCFQSECHVPRCRDLKELLRKKQSAVDSQPSSEDYCHRERGKEAMKQRIWKRQKPNTLQGCR